MTQRLYYEDSYVSTFESRVLRHLDGGRRLILESTAFYPTSGGQPFDLGFLNGVPVVEVVEEGDEIVHVLAAPLEGEIVEGRIDWSRRFDHMQQHTGQHLLSAVLAQKFGIPTLSFHLGGRTCTIDVQAGELSGARISELEESANSVLAENRPVRITFESAGDAAGLRKPSDREGTLRIVSIDGLDRSACGGTHVRATGEIGAIQLRGREKIRGNLRLEFLCGLRAVRQARSDFDALSRIAHVFSSTLQAAPQQVETQQAALVQMQKEYRKLALEAAAVRGRSAYKSCAPDSAGVRRLERAGEIDEQMRAEAQSFIANSRAVFTGFSLQPPAILLAASPDSGVDAGQLLKCALDAVGGRGGGGAQMAQGSAPSPEALAEVRARILG
ncbi:MAG TPA: alanyl-tRNA editing protein [Bryobacteraceae bacterium]|nr:alanyl-tRNA editing protein [Bryobacteraceae bacterium]